MSASFLAEARRGYAAMRGVSQGASITLTSSSGGYVARFDCATKAAHVMGDRNLRVSIYPTLEIPMDELHRSITKLAQMFSVALVDTVTDDKGTRFVLVWKIQPREMQPTIAKPQVAELVASVNQGSCNLDEY